MTMLKIHGSMAEYRSKEFFLKYSGWQKDEFVLQLIYWLFCCPKYTSYRFITVCVLQISFFIFTYCSVCIIRWQSGNIYVVFSVDIGGLSARSFRKKKRLEKYI